MALMLLKGVVGDFEMLKFEDLARDLSESPDIWRSRHENGAHPASPQMPGCNPRHHLVSLFEMLEFNAHQFVRLMGLITQMEARFETIISHTQDGIMAWGDDDWTGLKVSLAELKKLCVELELDSGADKVDRIEADLRRQDFRASQLTTALTELRHRIEDQLGRRVFMRIPNNRVWFFREKALFGSDVSNKFPDCLHDIEESGKCQGLGRWTGTVLHLMRVMENGVQRLAVELNVSVNPRATWGMILGMIDPAINAMPTTTPAEVERKAAFQDLKASLHAVKEAWRNPAMHGPKTTYTEEESFEIFGNVKSFMRKLAAVC